MPDRLPNRRRQTRKTPAIIPLHVSRCFERAKAAGEAHRAPWSLYIWHKADPARMTRIPYRCGSWRCPWCARHEAAVTWRRISDACRPHPAEGWVFSVLTLDRNGYYGADSPARAVVDALSALAGVPSRWGWRNSDDAYRALGAMTEQLRDELRRDAERAGWEETGNRWVATVEAHESGWPHVNLLWYSPGLAAELRWETRSFGERTHRDDCRCPDCRARILVRGRLRLLAERAGFGRQSTAEPIRKGTDAMAGYITKIAARADETAGEIAKITQAPLTAPVRFRRLRAGLEFLAPRQKNEAVTGTLVRRRPETDGTVTVLPLHKVKAADLEHVLRACYFEERCAHAELRVRWLMRAGTDPVGLYFATCALVPPIAPVPLSGAAAARAP